MKIGYQRVKLKEGDESTEIVEEDVEEKHAERNLAERNLVERNLVKENKKLIYYIMNRCDLSETNFRVNKNDKYSIRMLQPAGIQAKVGAIASHHYIDIEKGLGNNKKCLMTLGLRTENAKRAGHIGITRYLGTELLSQKSNPCYPGQPAPTNIE